MLLPAFSLIYCKDSLASVMERFFRTVFSAFFKSVRIYSHQHEKSFSSAGEKFLIGMGKDSHTDEKLGGRNEVDKFTKVWVQPVCNLIYLIYYQGFLR